MVSLEWDGIASQGNNPALKNINKQFFFSMNVIINVPLLTVFSVSLFEKSYFSTVQHKFPFGPYLHKTPKPIFSLLGDRVFSLHFFKKNHIASTVLLQAQNYDIDEA